MTVRTLAGVVGLMLFSALFLGMAAPGLDPGHLEEGKGH